MSVNYKVLVTFLLDIIEIYTINDSNGHYIGDPQAFEDKATVNEGVNVAKTLCD
jgi:hypothetical protein